MEREPFHADMEGEEKPKNYNDFIDQQFYNGPVYAKIGELMESHPEMHFELEGIMKSMKDTVEEIKAGEEPENFEGHISEKFNSGPVAKISGLRQEHPEASFEVEGLLRALKSTIDTVEKVGPEYFNKEQ